jgi:hypothetical protein
MNTTQYSVPIRRSGRMSASCTITLSDWARPDIDQHEVSRDHVGTAADETAEMRS